VIEVGPRYVLTCLIAKPDIRRLARRGGVKRISAMIYDDVRLAMKERLETVSGPNVAFLLSSLTKFQHRSSVTVLPMSSIERPRR
jgi:histone H4